MADIVDGTLSIKSDYSNWGNGYKRQTTQMSRGATNLLVASCRDAIIIGHEPSISTLAGAGRWAGWAGWAIFLTNFFVYQCTQGLIKTLGSMVIFDENQGVSDLIKHEFHRPIYIKIIKFLVIWHHFDCFYLKKWSENPSKSTENSPKTRNFTVFGTTAFEQLRFG